MGEEVSVEDVLQLISPGGEHDVLTTFLRAQKS